MLSTINNIPGIHYLFHTVKRRCHICCGRRHMCMTVSVHRRKMIEIEGDLEIDRSRSKAEFSSIEVKLQSHFWRVTVSL